jgi:hypothetical protein
MNNPNIQKIIAIQNYGASGTTLIHSLLDNHPKVISLPYLYGIPLYGLWDCYLSNIDNVSSSDVEKVARNNFMNFFYKECMEESSLKQMGDNKDQILLVDPTEFCKHLVSYLDNINNIKRKDFIVSTFIAFNLCFKKEFTDDAYICFPIHSQSKKHAKWLIEDFKEVKFLHMIREPVQNIGTIVKHINHVQMRNSIFKGLLNCAILQILCRKTAHWEEKNFSITYDKVPYFSDTKDIESRYLRLEDFHKKPKETIMKLIKWLNIEFKESLLQSTFMGLKWHNRSESQQVSGFNTKTISQKHNAYLNKFDRYRLLLLSKTEQIYFGYYKYKLIDKFFYLILPLFLIFPFRCDFNKKRLSIRWEALQKFYSNDKKLSINEWLIHNDMSNVTVGEIYEIFVKDKKSTKLTILAVLTSLPAFIGRICFNYIYGRYIMLLIWSSRLFSHDTKSYVKPL